MAEKSTEREREKGKKKEFFYSRIDFRMKTGGGGERRDVIYNEKRYG